MLAPNYAELNSREPNVQAAQILAANAIPWAPRDDLASLALIRHALQSGDIEAPTIGEPLLLLAKLSARPEEAMCLMTETDLGEPFEIVLDREPAQAAAQLLEEIVASLRALSPMPLL